MAEETDESTDWVKLLVYTFTFDGSTNTISRLHAEYHSCDYGENNDPDDFPGIDATDSGTVHLAVVNS